ncbi:hypothetical protein G9H61_03120 [Aquirufa ecclesiirivi]|uniref:RiboL-PSP-HEPN domain-containing protein n=1 Tax=Aquirufa ecclesiirivi TaxID=2715124 RepID=A0ABT4JF67_9BACT|nr:hypothetical protein [Aquirufa ecclesiirivi]MCZ2474419.1 hypothetical protein [Aquirufa ecclesiirivi]
MPHSDTYKFFQAYVTNVRDFLSAETEIRRTINRSLKTGKKLTASVQTKVYALLFSTYSEASFMKMILTPHGFDQPFVDEILRQESIQEKWLKCLELAFLKFSKQTKGSEVPNKTIGLKRIIQEFIVEPSVIRNKIAHGQLTIALNSKNTNLNPTITNQLDKLDFVTISRWFEINKQLCAIIEDLIESPDKAHYNYYYSKYQSLEAFIVKTNSWTVETKLNTKSMTKNVIRNGTTNP